MEGEEEITTKIVRERTTICTGGTYHTNRANKEANLLSSTRIAIFICMKYGFSYSNRGTNKQRHVLTAPLLSAGGVCNLTQRLLDAC